MEGSEEGIAEGSSTIPTASPVHHSSCGLQWLQQWQNRVIALPQWSPIPSWALSPILYPCFEEDCVTAQRASPLLEPGSGNVENGNLPSLVLRSNMLPKLFSLIFQHFVLSSSVSFSLHFPGPTSLQGAANTNHSSSKVSFEPPLRQGIGTSGMTTERLALGFQIPWFLPPGASKTDNDHNWCFCLFWLN